MATIRNDIDRVYGPDGTLVSERSVQRDITAETNAELLQSRISQALAANALYLSLPAYPAAPTNAQTVAAVRLLRDQTDALTRQVSALIRSLTRQFDTVD